MHLDSNAFGRQFAALPLGEAERTALLGVLEPVNWSAGEQVITLGQMVDTLYFLVSGTLSVSLHNGDSHLALGEVGPGRWVGELGMIEPGPASADVAAAEESTALALSHDGLNRLYAAAPEAASRLLERLSLDMADRFRTVGRQVLERVCDGDFVMHERDGAAESGWLRRIGAHLMGLRGDAA